MADSFRNRLIEAMRINNVKAADLARSTGLSKAQISQYVNGVYEAKQKALYKLAVALNVSPVWLMGKDVSKERTDDEKKSQREILEEIYDKETIDALSLFVSLDEIDRAKVVERMQMLLEDKKYQSKKGERTHRDNYNR